MVDISKTLVDGGILTGFFLALILGLAIYNPRLFLNKSDVPADIFAAVPPKTEKEKRQSKWLGIPLFLLLIGGPLYSTYTLSLQNPGLSFFPLFWHAFLVLLMPTLGDLFLVDWLLLNTLTPRFFVYPGTEGFAGYKDYGFHLKAHLRFFPMLPIGAAIIAVIVQLIS